MYNKIDTLEGSFEITSGTTLFCIEKAYLKVQKGVFLICKGHGQKIFTGMEPPDPRPPSFFPSGGNSTLAVTGGRDFPLFSGYSFHFIFQYGGWPFSLS